MDCLGRHGPADGSAPRSGILILDCGKCIETVCIQQIRLWQIQSPFSEDPPNVTSLYEIRVYPIN